MYYESELYHHGVKGMKWGVRKKRGTTTASKVSAKKEAYEDTRERYDEYRQAVRARRTAKKDYSQSKKNIWMS